MNAPLIDLRDAADVVTALVGGKGRQLGVLHRLGLPVPEGFVVTAPALENGLTDALRATVAAEIGRRGWVDTPLAVRSSAPQEDSSHASFAGIYHSELQVSGHAIDAALAAVRASLHTPQAEAYRARQGVGEASMAIVVMPMLPAVAAGVAFSCDPQSGRDDCMFINAVAGLGDKLVGGAESGEEIVIAEDRLTEALGVAGRRLAPGAAAPLLDDTAALELAGLLRDAAQAIDYADPAFDFEWVFDGARFWLVQARPVTARRWHAYPGLAGEEAIWANGNTRDVVPHPMGAMDWLGWRRMVDLMLEQGYLLAGYPLLEGVRRSALIKGRLYLNASLIQYEGYDALGIDPKAMNDLMGGHHAEIKVATASPRERLARGLRMFRYLRRQSAMRRRGKAQAAQAFVDTARWRDEDLTGLDDATLVERLRQIFVTVRTRDGMMFLQGSGGGNLHLLLELVGHHLPGQRHALVAAIMAGGEPSVTAQQAYELQQLAHLAATQPAVRAFLERGAPWSVEALPEGGFADAFNDFVRRYGHRGIYESYLASPRYAESPAYLLDAVSALLDHDPAERERQRAQSAEATWATLRRVLSPLKCWWAGALVGAARRELADRELARSAFVAYSAVTRHLLLELAERLRRRGLIARRDDVFALTPEEFFSAIAGRLSPSTLQARCLWRQAQLAEWEKLPVAEVIVGSRALAPATASRSVSGAWQGVAVGHGIAEGRARIVRTPEAGASLQAGEILVAPSTDPAWTPLFLRAAGLVMETGGYLSHGAIVAREFGIPAVVNLPGILEALADGARLRVDGTRGEVLVRDGDSA